MSHLIYSCVLQCAVLIFHSLLHPIYKHLSTLAFPLYCVWLFCSFVEFFIILPVACFAYYFRTTLSSQVGNLRFFVTTSSILSKYSSIASFKTKIPSEFTNTKVDADRDTATIETEERLTFNDESDQGTALSDIRHKCSTSGGGV